MKVELNRIDDNFHFEGIGESKISVSIDGSVKIGGSNQGARPMELVLMALGSCAAMDILSILKKQRQKVNNLKIEINGKRDLESVPAVFTEINLEFMFSGNIDNNKVERAVELSMKKYCSVSAMLEKSVKISYSINIMG